MMNIKIEELCCPLGKAPLEITKTNIICTKCGVKFPIKEGIPSLIMDSADLPEGINSINNLPCQKEIKADPK